MDVRRTPDWGELIRRLGEAKTWAEGRDLDMQRPDLLGWPDRAVPVRLVQAASDDGSLVVEVQAARLGTAPGPADWEPVAQVTFRHPQGLPAASLVGGHPVRDTEAPLRRLDGPGAGR